MRVPVTLDLHLPSFSFPGVGPDRLFETVAAIARTAERAGFSSISLMDHVQQIPLQGEPSNYMLEGSTLLAAIAASTERLTLGLLVGGVTYRNPAIAAKITTTLDVISRGRAWHGIGAGWFEDEHHAYGVRFPPLTERFERLEEALTISRAMFREGRSSFVGRHFVTDGALNEPRPLRGDIPILVGGSGERRTLALVARLADGCNLFGTPRRVAHLLAVLERHCAEVGRDSSQITKTALGRVLIERTHAAAVARKAQLRAAGASRGAVEALIAGDPDTVGARVQAFRDVGLDGYAISMPYVYDLESVELAGRTLAPIFAR